MRCSTRTTTHHFHFHAHLSLRFFHARSTSGSWPNNGTGASKLCVEGVGDAGR